MDLSQLSENELIALRREAAERIAQLRSEHEYKFTDQTITKYVTRCERCGSIWEDLDARDIQQGKHHHLTTVHGLEGPEAIKFIGS